MVSAQISRQEQGGAGRVELRDETASVDPVAASLEPRVDHGEVRGKSVAPDIGIAGGVDRDRVPFLVSIWVGVARKRLVWPAEIRAIDHRGAGRVELGHVRALGSRKSRLERTGGAQIG